MDDGNRKSKRAHWAPVAGTLAVLAFGGAALSSIGVDGVSSELSASTAAGEFAVDAGHSSVVFSVGYQNVARFYGRFNEVSGTYRFDFEDPANSEIDIAIPTASIDSNSEGRDNHLRGPDFFSAREFPTIRFVGKEFSPVDDDTMRVAGDLTLRGVTRPVSVDVDWLGQGPDFRSGTRSGFHTVLTIDRSDFGVMYGVDNGVLGDETEIIISLTGMMR
ncbi:MAG: YceI family protein [Planctomycetota bacterium]